MSDLTDGFGTAMEGGAYSRAVERETAGTGAAKGGKGHFHEHACLNCGTELIGSHCHNCGQEAHLHRTIGAFFHDLLHGVLHLDGKIWRTLPMLAFKPGKLTRDYIEGHRRRYVSPMALFLFSVFMMFAVFSMLGLSVPTDLKGPAIGDEQVEPAVANLDAEIEAAQDRLADEEAGSAAFTNIQREIDSLKAARKTVTGIAKSDEIVAEGKTGIASIDKGLEKWRKNPSLMVYKLQSSGYKFSWLLIPISMPFVWLMFAWKRRFGLYDHAVFVTYSIAFMSLLFIVASIAGVIGVPAGWIWPLCIAIPLVHIYKQLKYGYELSRFGAFVRTFAMTFVVGITTIIFLSVLLLLGVMG
ncbi:DUF3667 domain-containing protein [Croceicoccus mobilis]|uniref:DUF3667 domain-containing protein n=1 Tax=Croceicoccus mobilis TaxID=1703339 RepID=A0A917DVQ9_9SPHN|nr:DUF3667 domain-containing protein [Croceicoccus mobilis]GGD71994.1 hypothetical protein GCM10010990_21810 [Croceicoccus mobilis]